MAFTYAFQIISSDALEYNSSTGAFELIPDYDPDVHNLVVTVTDDDSIMNNMDGSDGTAIDTNQVATVTDMQGNVVADGMVYSPMYASVSMPNGSAAYLDRLEVDGERLGYSTSETLEAGGSFPVTYAGPYEDTHRYFADNGVAQGTPSTMICFGTGTLILTEDGMKPVEQIKAGDRVKTLDHGAQTVRWAGRTELKDKPDAPGPVVIDANALGPGQPARRLRVSPQHRVLWCEEQLDLNFGTPEVFVAAKHLLGQPGIRNAQPPDDFAYHHILFDRHEVVFAENLPVESLFLGDALRDMIVAPPKILALGLMHGHRQTARRCLSAREAFLLRSPAPMKRAS